MTGARTPEWICPPETPHNITHERELTRSAYVRLNGAYEHAVSLERQLAAAKALNYRLALLVCEHRENATVADLDKLLKGDF